MSRYLMVKATLLFLILLASSATHAGPPANGKWRVIPELTDEFVGGALDGGKWYDHNPRWPGRQPGFFSKANVSVQGGMLLLTDRAENLQGLPEGYHSFTTAAVQSRTLVKYGYFEIRSKAMNSIASSAFWFTRHTPDEWTEIDVFEMSGASKMYESTVVMTAHLFKNKDYSGTEADHIHDSYRWAAPFLPRDDFHVYALEWSKDYLTWYVDGKVVHQIENKYWHQALSMNFDSETMPSWFGLPDQKDMPATYYIDYVRSWASDDTEITPNN